MTVKDTELFVTVFSLTGSSIRSTTKTAGTGRSATECVLHWLYNELKHVEEGLEVGGGVPGARRELPPVYADLLFHGVLTSRPLGGMALP